MNKGEKMIHELLNDPGISEAFKAGLRRVLRQTAYARDVQRAIDAVTSKKPSKKVRADN